MKKRRLWLRLLVSGVLLGAYPAFVLIYTWSFVFASDFQGGRHGPLDAYRHALASSVVAHTLGKPAVELVTALFESKGKDSNVMDSHNNRVGAGIGAGSRSFQELEPAVRQAVLEGGEGVSDPTRITWLPEEKWRSGRLW
jgi:preprotein translocase subunit SecF